MSTYNTSSCFFPDGITDGSADNFVPCDPQAAVSACCVVGTTCLPNGLCLKEGGVMRGGCTDKGWFSSACATVCAATSGKLQGPQHTYAWLTQCVFAPQYKSFNWVCGISAHENCTSDNWFDIELANPTRIDITGLAADYEPSGSPSGAATPSASANASCASIDAAAAGRYSVNPAVVGAGVGAPLAILVLVMLVTMLWYRRKWIRLRDRDSGGMSSSSGQYQHHSVESPAGGMSEYIPPMELAHKRAYHAQLDHHQPAVYEIGNEGPGR